jgi:hypothetical protein
MYRLRPVQEGKWIVVSLLLEICRRMWQLSYRVSFMQITQFVNCKFVTILCTWIVWYYCTEKCMFFSRFKEAIFTTGKVQDTCILTNQPVKQSMTGCIVLGVIVSVGLILFLLAYCWNKAQRKRGNMHCCMLSSGWFTGVCSLNGNIWEHFVCSIFIGE